MQRNGNLYDMKEDDFASWSQFLEKNENIPDQNGLDTMPDPVGTIDPRLISGFEFGQPSLETITNTALTSENHVEAERQKKVNPKKTSKKRKTANHDNHNDNEEVNWQSEIAKLKSKQEELESANKKLQLEIEELKKANTRLEAQNGMIPILHQTLQPTVERVNQFTQVLSQHEKALAFMYHTMMPFVQSMYPFFEPLAPDAQTTRNSLQSTSSAPMPIAIPVSQPNTSDLVVKDAPVTSQTGYQQNNMFKERTTSALIQAQQNQNKTSKNGTPASQLHEKSHTYTRK